MRRTLLTIALLLLTAWAVLGATAAGSRSVSSNGVVLADTGGLLVAVNVDGSGVRTLTHPPGDAWDAKPVASPDGSLIAFVRSGASLSHLTTVELMRADGSAVRSVGDGDDPQWAPDGTLLAYESGSRISVVRPDGSGGRVLVSDQHRIGFTWSPDGKAIAYATAQGISAVDVGTGARQLLLKAAGAWGPAWSPDGSRIAFMVSIDSEPIGHDRIFVMNADGSAAHAIGPTPDTTETPNWSPDGTHIAFGESRFPKAGAVVVVDAATGGVTTTIPPLAGGESAMPSWSPDGDRIAFLRASELDRRADNGGDVWVAAADGTHPVQATRNFPFGGSQSTPRWLPGAAAITPDPPVPSAALPVSRFRSLGDRYLLAAVDGAAAAIVADGDTGNSDSSGSPLGVWRGRGAVSWIRTRCANLAALSGNRVYWSCYGSDHEGSTTELWTATWPGGRPVRLLHIDGEPDGPAAMVAGDRSLVVYSLRGSLWRLQGTTAKLIRHESVDVEPLSVDHGRVLLNKAGGLEVVDGTGRLLASLPVGKNDIWDCLSGNRVIAMSRSTIRVYRLPGGSLRSTWPVGLTGRAWRAGFPYGSLFPYRTATAYDETLYRVLDVDTGRDVAVTVGNRTSPRTAAITSAGFFYTATPLYAGVVGQVGFVPLAGIRAALR